MGSECPLPSPAGEALDFRVSWRPWKPQPASLSSPAQLAIQQASQQDRRKALDLLHIASLRNRANNRDPRSPNAVNYDEAEANPYPKLPDPLR
jgi:hypothetical protein